MSSLKIKENGVWRTVGGGGYPLIGNVSGFKAESAGENEIELNWTDPPDLIVDGEPIATWGGSKLMRKTLSFPINEKDGEMVIDSKIRSQFSSTPYVDVGVTGTQYYYMVFPYTDKKVVTIDPANRATATAEEFEEGSWAWVRWHVRNGTHLTEFAVGDVFTCLYNGSPINVMIIGMDVETPTNSSYTHSMTLHTVDCLPVTFQFDSPESGGHTDRQNYGNNRWMWSNVRQWLNSDASSYAWSSTHQYDKAPSSGFLSGYSGGGFLKLLDPELVAVLGSVEKKTALCDYDGVNGQDTTSEIAFLLSRYEAGLGTEGNTTGEFAYPWYNSNTRRVKKVGASNSIWWLRSPNVSYARFVRYVGTGGTLYYDRAYSTNGLAPACVII